MGFAVNVISGPTEEPVPLEGDGGLKQWLRVDSDDEDALILSLAKAARRRIEREYDVALVTQTLALSIDRFPIPGNPYLWQQYSWGGWFNRIPTTNLTGSAWPDRAAIFVPRPPLQSVASITYTAQGNVKTTLDPSQYQVDSARMPARIVPAYGLYWPIIELIPDCVQVTYVAGYGGAAAVPDTVKTAIKILTAQAYENREEPGELSAGVRALLLSEWSGEYY